VIKNPIKIFLFLIFFFYSDSVFCFNYKPIHEFEIFRNNKKIGFHKLSFQNIEDKIVVNTQIEMVVKFGIIPVFKYFHKSKEIWANNQLIEAKTSTRKNARNFEFLAKRNGSKIEIKSRGKVFMVEGNSLITSYWHQNWFKKKILIDSQHGKERLINVEKKGFEEIKTLNNTIFAQKYRILGRQNKPNGKKINTDVWYDEKGRLVKIKFYIRNSLIEYFLVTRY
jgi:hypothetical protein